MTNRRVDVRMVRALLASIATGVVVYLIVIRGALPLLARRLTSEQIDWLRTAFAAHPWVVLGQHRPHRSDSGVAVAGGVQGCVRPHEATLAP